MTEEPKIDLSNVVNIRDLCRECKSFGPMPANFRMDHVVSIMDLITPWNNDSFIMIPEGAEPFNLNAVSMRHIDKRQ